MRIVVDSSALLAVLLDEPERPRFHDLLLAAEPVVSVVSVVEVYNVVFGRFGPEAMSRVDAHLLEYAVEFRSVEAKDLPVLKQAMLDFGKGRGRPPAALNFGDLFAYALAKRLDLPLLFKGDDFARTDVRPALP